MLPTLEAAGTGAEAAAEQTGRRQVQEAEAGEDLTAGRPGGGPQDRELRPSRRGEEDEGERGRPQAGDYGARAQWVRDPQAVRHGRGLLVTLAHPHPDTSFQSGGQ